MRNRAGRSGSEDGLGPKIQADPPALKFKVVKETSNSLQMSVSSPFRLYDADPPARAETPPWEQPPVARKRHLNWALKAVLPIAAVLLNGLLFFVLGSLWLAEGGRHVFGAVGAVGAFPICVAVIMVLAVSVRGPMLELHDKIARVR